MINFLNKSNPIFNLKNNFIINNRMGWTKSEPSLLEIVITLLLSKYRISSKIFSGYNNKIYIDLKWTEDHFFTLDIFFNDFDNFYIAAVIETDQNKHISYIWGERFVRLSKDPEREMDDTDFYVYDVQKALLEIFDKISELPNNITEGKPDWLEQNGK